MEKKEESKKIIITWLRSMRRLGIENKNYKLPLPLKLEILSYLPDKIYSLPLLKRMITSRFITKQQIKVCGFPADWLTEIAKVVDSETKKVIEKTLEERTTAAARRKGRVPQDRSL